MNHEEAVAFLDARIGHGRKPGLERISGLLGVLADPHVTYPVIQVAGTVGKTSVTWMTAALLNANGVHTGTYVSPHLHEVEERFAIDGVDMTPDEFAVAMSDIAPAVELYEQRSGQGVTYFELTTGLAYAWFAEQSVGAAVVEVGLGGRWDATSVVSPEVAVISGIGWDHQEYLGSSLKEIAAEKAAIIDEESVVVTGALGEEASTVVGQRTADLGAAWLAMGRDFDLSSDVPAVGGRLLSIDGVHGTYENVFLPLHGAYQAQNFAVAVAAGEAFFGRALHPDVVVAAAGAVESPGRLEVMRRRPLVVLDGAHNITGMEALAAALGEEFPSDLEWIGLVGLTGPRDAQAVFAPLLGTVERFVAVRAPSDRGVDAERVAAGLGRLGAEVTTAGDPDTALDTLLAGAGDGQAILVTGSLYLVGALRHHLVAG